MGINFGRYYVDLELKSWHLSVYLEPRVWGLNFHRNAPCCKWWLLFGPFEINRVWTDGDTYPFGDDE